MRVIVIQPAVPSYRLGFFNRLAERLGPAFAVHASAQDMGVLSERATISNWEYSLGPLRRVLPGVFWQPDVLSIPLARGDIVVVSGAPRCLSNIAFLLKAKIRGAKTIWWGHYWSSTSRPWRAGVRMLLMQLSDAILFYTDREVEEYLATRRRIRQPVSALNNGIETDEIFRLRAPYVVSSRPRDLLFVGRITPKTELELLLEALALPTADGIQLDVIGNGEVEERLRKRCTELGIADRVAWHGGSTDEQRIAAIANSCKAFVYPGSVGLSLIHGFAYGLPAIVHDNRWQHMPEIAALTPNKNGVTFRQGDTVSLARAIATLLADPERLATMAAAAITTTECSFNAADMAERFCSAVEAVRETFNLVNNPRRKQQPEQES